MRKLIAVALVAGLCLVSGAAQARQAGVRTAIVSAYDLTDTSYAYYKAGVGGTAATDGWIAVGPASVIQATITWTTKAATSMEYSVECRTTSVQPYTVRQASMSAVGTDVVVISPHAFEACRVGLKLSTDTGTNAVTATLTTGYEEGN